MEKRPKSGNSKGTEIRKTPEAILAEYENYRAQAETLRRSLDLIVASLEEIAIVKNSLDKISNLKEDNEILVPLGGDSFVRAAVKNRETVIVGLGANVAVGKSIAEAKEGLEKRAEELEKIRAERTDALQRTAKKLEELSPAVQRVLSELTKEG